MIESIESILNFWFKGVNDETLIKKNDEPFKFWFKRSRTYDENIRNKFSKTVDFAKEGDLSQWEETSQGKLALILLLDQFTRNLYRNTKKMYESDAYAIKICKNTVIDSYERSLKQIERLFFYMPLMHSENIEDQQLSVECFSRLVKDCQSINSHNTHYYVYHLNFAKKFYDIIKEFGRFPHRNKILDRESTEKEKDYLNVRQSL